MGELSSMRKSAFAALLLVAALAFAWGHNAAELTQLSGLGSNWQENLAKASVLGQGMLPALLFGGSFAALLFALIVSGFIGMARNAPTNPPKSQRARKTEKARSAEQMQTV